MDGYTRSFANINYTWYGNKQICCTILSLEASSSYVPATRTPLTGRHVIQPETDSNANPTGFDHSLSFCRISKGNTQNPFNQYAIYKSRKQINIELAKQKLT